VPDSLVARVPAEQRGAGLGRDAVRLLVSQGTEVAHRAFTELPALLRAWADAPHGGCLYLLADPQTDGEPVDLEARVLAAAAGIDLDACPDIAILREHGAPGRDAALHAAADAYVPLHAACAGHRRLAGAAVVELDDLGAWLAARPPQQASLAA